MIGWRATPAYTGFIYDEYRADSIVRLKSAYNSALRKRAYKKTKC
jgi:hypothetical protein